MSFDIEKDGDTVVVGIAGQLTVENRQQFKELVLDEIGRGERAFRLDFGETRYIDSSGLGALVSLSKRIRQERGTLRLVNLDEQLRKLFALTKLDTLFGMGETGESDGPADGGVPAPVRPRPRSGGGHEQWARGEEDRGRDATA